MSPIPVKTSLSFKSREQPCHFASSVYHMSHHKYNHSLTLGWDALQQDKPLVDGTIPPNNKKWLCFDSPYQDAVERIALLIPVWGSGTRKTIWYPGLTRKREWLCSKQKPTTRLTAIPAISWDRMIYAPRFTAPARLRRGLVAEYTSWKLEPWLHFDTGSPFQYGYFLLCNTRADHALGLWLGW